jgi:quercetin dioxygenase-like cupin family protein
MHPQNPEPQNSLWDKFIGSPARFFSATTTLLILFFAMHTASADAANSGLIRTILMENPVELASKNINTKVIRVTFPPAFRTPWHTHEGPGPRYVVKGKLKVTEDGKVNTYSIGEVFWESGKLMQVENVGKETAELIIFEMVSSH